MEINIEKKYIPLANYFQASKEGILKLSFSEIETIVGQKLPNAAYLNKSWWKKTKPPLHHFLAWTENGYFVSKVQPGYYVQFEKPQFQFSNLDTESATSNYTYIIRPAELDDSKNIVNLLAQLKEQHTLFHYDALHTPETPQNLRKRIATWNAKNNGQVFVAIVDGHLHGVVQIMKNTASALQHRAEISLAISNDFSIKKIDIALLEAAKRWATLNKVSRLDVSLLKSNDIVSERFIDYGFTIEGTRKNALYMNNTFYDEIFLGKIL